MLYYPLDRVASGRPEAAWPPQGEAGINMHYRRCKMKEKKQWQKPELIVLVRSKPEEAVLQGCKEYNLDGAGTHASICYYNEPDSCDWECYALLGS